MEQDQVKEVKPEAIRQLDASANRMGLVEHEQLQYVVTVEQGTTRKDILNPLFWAHVAAKLKPYTIQNLIHQLGESSYPGIGFHIQQDHDAERVVYGASWAALAARQWSLEEITAGRAWRTLNA